MNIASKELCRELFEAGNWNFMGTDFVWVEGKKEPVLNVGMAFLYPAYDLGYLLRKLPPHHAIYQTPRGQYIAGYIVDAMFVPKLKADTPEDAACKLAINLIKQGILKGEK